MFENKSFLAVIPARGGSQGLINKNTKLLLGHPLVAWPIMAAKASGIFDSIIVYSDSSEIRSIATDYGVDSMVEPAELATSYALVADAMVDCLKRLGRQYDYVQLLQATSPGVTGFQIRAAANQLINLRNGDMIIGMHEFHDPTIVVKPLLPNHSVKGWYPDLFKDKTRQQLPRSYRINGYIYLAKWDVWMSRMDYWQSNIYAYLCNPDDDIDIDTIFDWDYAEFKLGRMKGSLNAEPICSNLQRNQVQDNAGEDTETKTVSFTTGHRTD